MFRSLARWFGLVPTDIKLLVSPAPAVSSSPHERYPEIMHWQEGDELRNSTGKHNLFWFSLIRITESGVVYGQNKLDDHKFGQPLWMVMRDGSNLSLKDREINETLKMSDEYMALIREFNVAFAELQERDKKTTQVA